MTRPRSTEAKPSRRLSRTACLLSLKKTLKEHGPVYGEVPFTLAVVVPESLISEYVAAFRNLQQTEPVLAEIELSVVASKTRGRRDSARLARCCGLATRSSCYSTRATAFRLF